MALPEENPVYGPFFGVMGAASAIIFSGKLSVRQRKAKWMNILKTWQKIWKFSIVEISP